MKLFIEVRVVDEAGTEYSSTRRIAFDTAGQDEHLARDPMMMKQDYLRARNLVDEGMPTLAVSIETGYPLQQVNYATLCATYEKYCDQWHRRA